MSIFTGHGIASALLLVSTLLTPVYAFTSGGVNSVKCESIFSSFPDNGNSVPPSKIVARIDNYIRQYLQDMADSPNIRLSAFSHLIADPSFTSELRLSPKVRIQNARALVPQKNKFKTISDEQLKQQWEDSSSLNLPNDATRFRYLSPVSGLKRGDFVKATRLVYLTEANLRELVETRLMTSHVLNVMNYDLPYTQTIFEMIGLRSLHDIYRRQLGFGSTAVSTTYAINGFGNTRTDKPLIFDPQKNVFALQIELKIPVEAIVLVQAKPNERFSFEGGTPYLLPKRMPEHVEADPTGFGFVMKNLELHQESEITFMNAIPPDWITTDLNSVRDILNKRTYPVHSGRSGHDYSM